MTTVWLSRVPWAAVAAWLAPARRQRPLPHCLPTALAKVSSTLALLFFLFLIYFYLGLCFCKKRKTFGRNFNFFQETVHFLDLTWLMGDCTCPSSASARGRKNVISCLTVSDSPVSENEASDVGHKAGFRPIKDEHGSGAVTFVAVDSSQPASSSSSSGKSSSTNASHSNSNSARTSRHRTLLAPPPDLISDALHSAITQETTGPGKPHHQSMCNIPKQEANTGAAVVVSGTRHHHHHNSRRGHSLTPPKQDIKFPPLVVDVTPINPATHAKFQQISPSNNNNHNHNSCHHRSRPSTLNLNDTSIATTIDNSHSHQPLLSHHHHHHHYHGNGGGHQGNTGTSSLLSGSHKQRPAPLNLGGGRVGVNLQQHSPPSMAISMGHAPQAGQPVYLNTLSSLNTLNTLNTLNSFNNATVPDNYRWVIDPGHGPGFTRGRLVK